MDSIGRRDDPNLRLAGERTLLAWVRTGLGLMGFGFVVARFGLFLREWAVLSGRDDSGSSIESLGIGTGLVVLGVLVVLIAAGQHFQFLRRIDRGQPYCPPRWSLSLALAGGLSLVGGVMILHLLLRLI